MPCYMWRTRRHRHLSLLQSILKCRTFWCNHTHSLRQPPSTLYCATILVLQLTNLLCTLPGTSSATRGLQMGQPPCGIFLYGKSCNLLFGRFSVYKLNYTCIYICRTRCVLHFFGMKHVTVYITNYHEPQPVGLLPLIQNA